MSAPRLPAEAATGLGAYRMGWAGPTRWDPAAYTALGLLAGTLLMFVLVPLGFFDDDLDLVRQVLVPQLVAVALLAGALLAVRAALAPRVWLFDGGLVYRGNRREAPTARSWREVSVTGRPGARFAIRRADGTELAVRPVAFRLAARRRLCAAIERELVAARLPEALAGVRAGARRSFGPVAVDQHGVHTGSVSLAWREVRAVDASATRPRLETDDGWVDLSAEAVPDLALLLALVDALRR